MLRLGAARWSTARLIAAVSVMRLGWTGRTKTCRYEFRGSRVFEVDEVERTSEPLAQLAGWPAFAYKKSRLVSRVDLALGLGVLWP